MPFESTNSALRLAIKTKSIKLERVQTSTKQLKATANSGVPLTNPKAGDHRSMPAMKIAARARATIPLSVKQELIVSCGFSDLGRKRTRALPKPRVLKRANRVMADMTAAPQPTSDSEKNRATTIQKRNPSPVAAIVLAISKKEFR